jgi:Fe-S-cluster containining protein
VQTPPPIPYNADYMRLFMRKPPWYAGGLAFECIRCGRCCAGPEEGYVWINQQEIDALAEFLKLPLEEVRDRYLRRVGKRISLKEDPKTRDCVFLSYDSSDLSGCKIYAVRPAQCRSWPFWPLNLEDPGSWIAAGRRCPGINRGPQFDYDEIRGKRNLADP